jgi:hypothetical protein
VSSQPASSVPDRVVLLETINPLDITHADLEHLAHDLSARLPELEFLPAYEDQHGAGVTFHEVLRVWLPAAFHDTTIRAILAVAVAWMCGRFASPHGSRRPKSIMVHNAETGEETHSLTIPSVDAHPTPRPTKPGRRKRPPIRRSAG